MTKYTIPTILLATVLVAGIFAFMPIEQASTVHTTIQATQLVTDRVSFAVGVDNLADDNQIQIQCGVTAAAQDRPFIVLELTIQTVLDDAADDFDIDGVEIDESALTDDGALTLTAMQVNANVITNNFDFIPREGQFGVLAANGELDLIVLQAGGDLATDNIGASAMILKQSDTLCAMNTGAND